MADVPKTTNRRLINAKRLLKSAGWVVLPQSTARRFTMLDQCEYPDHFGEPGDCCINTTSRNRKTKTGTMWLCSVHFAAPLSELFDERVSNDG